MSDPLKERPVGSYLLVIDLAEEKRIEVGRLGPILFVEGTYVYAGSAKNGLFPRLKRHFSEEKKIHWHIDYLLEESRPLYALAFEDLTTTECALGQFVSQFPGSRPINDFGCSDCKCQTHLNWINPNCLSRIMKRFPQARCFSAKDLHKAL